MKITYKYDFEAFMALQNARKKTWPRYRIGYWIMLIVGFIYGGWGAYGIFTLQSHDITDYMLYLAALGFGTFLFALAVFVPFKYKRSYRTQNLDGREINFEYLPDKIYFSTLQGSGELKWTSYQKVTEMPNHFVFWHNRLLGESVPKSAFGNNEQLEVLREILRQNFAEKDYVR